MDTNNKEFYSREDFNKVRKYLKTIYSADNEKILPTKKKKNLEIKWDIAVRTLRKTSTIADKSNSLLMAIKVVRAMIVSGYKDTEDYKKRLEELVDNHLDALTKFNLTRYEAYRTSWDDPLSLDEIIEKNKTLEKNVKGGDIIKVVCKPKRPSEKIKELLPQNPWDAYPDARAMKRHFIIHVGGTNTGKTYQSLERLKSVSSGAYLGPLRLLAMEVYEKLNLDGVPCNLLTGEQEDDIPGSKHVASTIEMADYSTHYDVVVIDECQMIEDKDRGGNWTEAIMGMLAPEIHLCMAPTALDICKKIIENCGDTFKIIEHERFVPLIPQIPATKRFDIDKDLQDGDALIVFSRKAVLNLAKELHDKGVEASVIYGALPYETRKKQVERFVNKETRVVVSTDAIGMGLNLPIHRIVFMETSKYDGSSVRRLKQEEIKQVAGRAGRQGMYDEGYVTAAARGDAQFIRDQINGKVTPLKRALINFPETLIGKIDEPLKSVISVWGSMKQDEPYVKQDVSRLVYLISVIHTKSKAHLSDKELYDVCTVPFDEDDYSHLSLWRSYIEEYAKKRGTDKALTKPSKAGLECSDEDKLAAYENYYKALALYFGFAKKMGLKWDNEWLNKELNEVSEKINELLIKEMSKRKHCCVRCRRPLPWNHTYKLCDECYERNWRKQYEHDWDDYF